MRKIFLSAGHSNKLGRDNGAVAVHSGVTYREGVLAAELRSMIATKLKNIHGITAEVDEDDSILSQTLNFFKNKTTSTCIVVDIHFNSSSNPLATGCEVLIPAPFTTFEADLADDLSASISLDIGVKNRGVKTEAQSHHGRLGWMRLTGENVLLEICFISNEKDVKKYEQYKSQLATSLACVLAGYAKR
jgi:N-acetylmuramoyl-L-alanine amidase